MKLKLVGSFFSLWALTPLDMNTQTVNRQHGEVNLLLLCSQYFLDLNRIPGMRNRTLQAPPHELIF